MNAFRLLLLALATSLLTLPGVARETPKDLAVGNRVAAIWTDGHYYIGTVQAIRAKVVVLFDDGDHRPIPLDKVFAIRKGIEYKVGDHVLAVWKKSQMFPGTISEVRPNECLVKWDDGDSPKLVAVSRMLPWPQP